MKSHEPHRPRRQRKPWLEILDDRTMLDAGGISAFMSLSFVPDGTAVSNQRSELFASLDQVASTAEWQQAIELAFNSWAVHTNADIAMVPDSGDPLGVPGRREGDDRFGDVRVSAVPLADNVMAISFPRDNAALGTWSSDIIFNSNVTWQSIDQITAIALHEAGHIFGLEHSEDPTSAMHSHGASSVTQPTPEDIANVQFLFGNRSIDPNEDEEDDNDDFEFATNLVTNLGGDTLAVSYGDISSLGDADVYRVSTEDDIEGIVFVEVQSNGLSLLSPLVEIFDEDGELLESVEAEDGIARLTYEFEETEEFFVSVSSDEADASSVGRYAVSVTIVEEEFDDDEYDAFLDGDLYSLNQAALTEFIRSQDSEPLFDREEDENDDFANAQVLLPTSTNAGRTWYEQLGSISAGTDADVYMIESPEDLDDVQNIMTVNLQSVSAGGLIPHVTVFNADGDDVETEIVVNGNGELVIQTLNDFDIDTEDGYFVVVEAANPTGVFAQGNYKMTINYGSDFVDLSDFSTGELSAASPVEVRSLHIASPQLMHFLFESKSETADVVSTMDVFDDSGNNVFSLSTQTGHARSGANPLLSPGTYTVRFGLLGNYPDNFASTFELRGVANSNPLGVIPVDPTNEPAFTCEGTSDQFCYPGGTTSDSPFFWEDFINDFPVPEPDPFDPFPVSDPDVFWWDWYFENSQSNNTPPTTLEDTFRVRNGDLNIGAANGILANDQSHANGPLIAAVHTAPTNGTLDLSTDGSFRYVPNPGFFGTDSFSYQAFDNSPSRATSVTLVVSRAGDVDDDGQVAFADFLIFARNFDANAVDWAEGDFSGDGLVTFADFLLLADNFGK